MPTTLYNHKQIDKSLFKERRNALHLPEDSQECLVLAATDEKMIRKYCTFARIHIHTLRSFDSSIKVFNLKR